MRAILVQIAPAIHVFSFLVSDLYESENRHELVRRVYCCTRICECVMSQASTTALYTETKKRSEGAPRVS